MGNKINFYVKRKENYARIYYQGEKSDRLA